jgi:D-3-phosphoglycerate dehydrogenase
VGVQIASQVREYLKRGVIQNAVNMPSIEHEQYVQMRPYIALAEKLGAFLAHVISGPVQEITILYGGQIAEWKTELIRNAAIQGVLNQLVAERANVVNAASMAQERGIQLHEGKYSQGSESTVGNLLSVTLKTPSDEHSVRGTILHGGSLRLTGVDNIRIEIPLEGKLICIRNNDVPGVIGKIGTILGKHTINIANLALGRSNESGRWEAIAMVQVDSSASDDVLQEIRRMTEVQDVRSIEF